MRMVYALGTYLGFKACHFDVRKANEKVWKFHESVGAERMSEDAISYHYEIRTPAIQRLADAIDARISG